MIHLSMTVYFHTTSLSVQLAITNIYSSIHLFIFPSTHLSNHSSSHPPTYPFNQPLNPPTYPVAQPSTHLTIHPAIHQPSTNSSIQFIHQPTHPSIEWIIYFQINVRLKAIFQYTKIFFKIK